MAGTPSASVVMAAHDSAATIGRAIASVRLQTRDDWELIVVDDGSTDATAAIASSFGDERVRVVRQENRGPAAARNAGIRVARAPLVSTLDSDDLWMPSYLDTMIETLRDASDASLAYTDAWVIDASDRVRRTSEMGGRAPGSPPASPRLFYGKLLRRNFVYNSVTARREALEAAGGYDERLRTSEDWELWLRLAAAGRRFVRAPGLLAIHCNRAGSLSSDAARLKAGRSEVFDIIERDWEIDDEARSLSARIRAEREAEPSLDALLSPRVARSIRTAREVIRRRVVWHPRPPHEVAEVLAAVDADIRAARTDHS